MINLLEMIIQRYGMLILVGGLLALSACSHTEDGINLPPLGSVEASSSSGYAPFQVAFDASSSLDPDGWLTRYEWNFGDGTTARGAQVEHIFADDGDYTVALTVRDNRGAEATTTVMIEVMNPPPIAQFSYSPQEPIVGQVMRFSASTSYDPASVGPKTVTDYHWNFGDGDEATGVIVEHVYVVPTEYTVTLTVTDDDGAESTAERVVEIGFPAPPPPPG